jgi:hypothetical protein
MIEMGTVAPANTENEAEPLVGAMVKLSVVFAVTVKLTVVGIKVLPVVAETVMGTFETSAIFAAVVMVKATVCEWTPSRVTLVGLKLQTAPDGRPAVQPPRGVDAGLKLTVWLNPLSGVTVIVEVAGCPAATLRVNGSGASVNGTATLTAAGADTDALSDASPW